MYVKGHAALKAFAKANGMKLFNLEHLVYNCKGRF